MASPVVRDRLVKGQEKKAKLNVYTDRTCAIIARSKGLVKFVFTVPNMITITSYYYVKPKCLEINLKKLLNKLG